MERDKHLGIKIDSKTHSKLISISKYEGRSMSGQILYLIQSCVREFEKKHGPIEADEKE